MKEKMKLFIKMKIEANLDNYDILYKRFKLTRYECLDKLLIEYYNILNIIEDTYPKNHIFNKEQFVFDELLFAMAYCKFISKKYLKNEEIINDFIIKKLKSLHKGEFSIKTFNENCSEFIIFFYLICSIFFKSDLYKDFSHIEYEPNGAKNKKIEYSFIFKDIILNIEVKALDCEPFRKDRDVLTGVADGDLFAKVYFPGRELKEYIDRDKYDNIKELKSNYRQLNKNIKRINEKFLHKNNNEINIGFVIINYGTSREEYISYLLHKDNGILNNFKELNIDNLVLFSMCACTSLFFEEILEKQHLFSILNVDKIKKYDCLFNKLRLDNYIFWGKGYVASELNEIEEIDEEYHIFKYVLKNGLCNFCRVEIDDAEIANEMEEIKERLSINKKIMKIIKTKL